MTKYLIRKSEAGFTSFNFTIFKLSAKNMSSIPIMFPAMGKLKKNCKDSPINRKRKISNRDFIMRTVFIVFEDLPNWKCYDFGQIYPFCM